MALVDYASSDEEGSEELQTANENVSSASLKRKRNSSSSDLPPLPSKFHDLYASTTRVSTRDDPSLHGGRKRITPHVEGMWPTHLYIEWYPSATEYSSLSKLISSVITDAKPEAAIHTFLTSDLGAPLPLHISLSRPISFATQQKESFVSALDSIVKSSGIRPFSISFTNLDWVANFESTRWFLVLRIPKPDTDGLNKLLHISNTTVQEYGQPQLYTKDITSGSNSVSKTKTPPGRISQDKKKRIKYRSKHDWSSMQDVSEAYHISIAWTLSAPSQELVQSTKKIVADHFEEIKQIKVKVEEIKSKVGNVVTSLSLPSNVVEGKSLFGV